MFIVDYCLANVMQDDILCVLLDDGRDDEGREEEEKMSITRLSWARSASNSLRVSFGDGILRRSTEELRKPLLGLK